MDLRAVDLNLLVVFDALATHRSVTLAAEAIGLSQPATSAALARLRTLFTDPLFVKAGPEMQPTPRALQIATAVRQVLDTIQSDVLQAPSFAPETSVRVFHLMTPDVGASIFLPLLLLRIATAAPGVDLKTVSLPPHAAADALTRGAVELALGYYPDLQQAGLVQQALLQTEHVCIVRRDHARIGSTLSLDEFLAAEHAVARPTGREHVFEQFLQRRGLRRRVRVEVAEFMALLPLVSQSDLIATVPREFAKVCERYGNIRLLEPPVKAPAVQVNLYWHERFQRDPAHAWLRALVRELFQEPARPRSARGRT